MGSDRIGPDAQAGDEVIGAAERVGDDAVVAERHGGGPGAGDLADQDAPGERAVGGPDRARCDAGPMARSALPRTFYKFLSDAYECSPFGAIGDLSG